MKELLKQVINGDLQEVDIPFMPIVKIEVDLRELGINVKDCEVDTNGRDIDFWYTYENKYVLSGTLYYGDLTFKRK